MMKLFYSPTSPYVRKVRMVILEKGLTDLIEIDERSPYDLEDELIAANPLCKVPALVLEDGSTLFDSPVVCEYLDSLKPTSKLMPEGAARWSVMRMVALADGMTDAAYNARMESMRPDADQSATDMAAQRARIMRGITALDAGELPGTDVLDLGTIALAASLGYTDLRHDDLNWRDGHPALAAWMGEFSKRPSFQATIPEG